MDKSYPSVLDHLVDRKLERRKKEKLQSEVLALPKAPTPPVMKK